MDAGRKIGDGFAAGASGRQIEEREIRISGTGRKAAKKRKENI